MCFEFQIGLAAIKVDVALKVLTTYMHSNKCD
jgi:hypothetical protein